MLNASGLYPNEKLTLYPHMFPRDIEIWERFLENPSNNYIGFDYDLKVGTGSEILPGTPENYALMQETLSKFRIDVVGYLGSSIDIIEVKPDASTSAIGQILSYVHLFERDYGPSLPVRGVLVTNRELPDVRHLTKEFGIIYYVVEHICNGADGY